MHAHDAIQSTNGSVLIRSPSGDTDIFVIAVALISSSPRLCLDYGVGKNRKTINLKKIPLSQQIKSSLIGFHSFTGNDYVSSFFRKGKATCFNVMKENSEFLEAFAALGECWSLSEDVANQLESFVCKLYGYRESNINNVRKKIFEKKCKKEGKIVDLANLPPCKSVLKLHTLRANYVAKVWKCSLENMVDYPDITLHGWNEDGSVKWVDEVFPNDVEEILLHEEYDDDGENPEEDTYEPSDDEDDEF